MYYMEVDKVLKDLSVDEDLDVLVDLGCGDGRWIVQAARDYHVRAIGYEIDEERIALARHSIKSAGIEHLASIVNQDLFKAPLTSGKIIFEYSCECNSQLIVRCLIHLATVVVVYLFSGALMEKLGQKLKSELVINPIRAYIPIVSVGFALPDLWRKYLHSTERLDGIVFYRYHFTP
jgi:hypothetical protein